jgi:hypothetical protein
LYDRAAGLCGGRRMVVELVAHATAGAKTKAFSLSRRKWQAIFLDNDDASH